MPTAAIELNDAGILIVAEDRPCGEASPGFALVDDGRLVTGREARSSARLMPRQMHSRFWSELSSAPLGRPFPANLSAADLAHAHLADLWRAGGPDFDNALLVVPGSLTEPQLGLLLGIARACNVPVNGLVDAAIVAAHGAGLTEGRAVYCDLHLHQAVLTEVHAGDEITRGRVDIGPDVGLVAVQDAWMRHIATLFVRQTRFDPTYAATSEQQLYDRVHTWLSRLTANDAGGAARGASVDATIDAGSREQSIELTLADYVAAASLFNEQLLDLIRRTLETTHATTLILSHRFAELPGLATSLEALGDVRVVSLAPATAPARALVWRSAIEAPGDALPYVTRLPNGPAAPAHGHGGDRGSGGDAVRPLDTATRPQADTVPPTHLVIDGRAYRVDERPFTVGTVEPDGRGSRLRGNVAGISRRHCSVARRTDNEGNVFVDDHSTHGTFVNGGRVTGAVRLGAGDRIRVGSPGIEILLIVVDPAETAEG